MQSELLDNVQELERKRAMPYISSFERRGLERGLKQGLEQGLEQGQRQALSKLLKSQLTKRFGALPRSVEERLRDAASTELQAWGEAVVDAPTLDSVFAPR
jgi:flagellar biosynthesis/type III secretory pathway protein FliH